MIDRLNFKVLLIMAVYSLIVSTSLAQYDTESTSTDSTSEVKAASDYIGFYQKYISAIRGAECPMYPSCSRYGMQAFNEASFASAMALTADRLLRCGHDHAHYPLTIQENGFRLLDYPGTDSSPEALVYHGNVFHFPYGDSNKDDSTKAFIKRLITSGFHSEALLEIMRVEHFKDPCLDEELFINKIVCLRALEEQEKILYEFEVRCSTASRNSPTLLYQIALTHHDLGNHLTTISYCDQALILTDNEQISNKLLKLQGLSHASLFDWESASRVFSTIESEQRESIDKSLSILQNTADMKRKSPFVAGMISLIPGAGYAYTGHEQTAISALLVNGLLAYATYSNLDKENYGMGILTGVFNLTFYLGNIQGAVKSAKKYNKSKKSDVIRKLKYYNRL